jgi:hypothetical protein
MNDGLRLRLRPRRRQSRGLLVGGAKLSVPVQNVRDIYVDNDGVFLRASESERRRRKSVRNQCLYVRTFGGIFSWGQGADPLPCFTFACTSFYDSFDRTSFEL